MTIEEKAYAYDVALARAKGMYESRDDAELAAYIFPELKESEDERIRKALVDLVSTVGEYYLKLDSRNKMLAWLEKQKEQKPVEWSEEDEAMLLSIINAFRNGTVSTIGQEQWLRYLPMRCPKKSDNWKPSEEQMSMLLAVIRDPNNAGSESCFLAFKSLYEDLKKL